jgi:hypothetical protein
LVSPWLVIDAAVQYLAQSIELTFDTALTFRDPLLDGAERHLIEVARTRATTLR